MSLVLGIDPGHSGAFAVYDTDAQRIATMDDMPTWYQTVTKQRKRPRIDALAVADYFDTFEMMGVALIVLEAVGGRPSQGAGAAYVFGYGVGLLYMAGIYSRIPIETVPPATWKKLMGIQGKGKADDSAIMQRANELFPLDRDKFLTPRGGKRVDRAEAAMLAKYGGDYVLRTMGTTTDIENRLSYRNAVTEL